LNLKKESRTFRVNSVSPRRIGPNKIGLKGLLVQINFLPFTVIIPLL